MKTLNSIEEISRVFETKGSRPVLVNCNDYNDWICKYDRDSRNLFNELLASNFAKLWNIPTPEISLVKIKKEHIPKDKTYLLQPRFFEKECFGSFYLENSKEIDESVISLIKHNKKRIVNKEDFLKIALFDLWLCNEDRHQFNYNILLCIDSDKFYFFYAIDHIQIFNSNHLERDLAELTEDESIINSRVAKILFKDKVKTKEIVDNLVDNFYLCTEKCRENLNEILSQVTDSWKIDKKETKEKLNSKLFSKDWQNSCVRHFRELTQIFLIN